MIRSKFDKFQFIGQFVLTGLLVVCGFAFYGGFYGKKHTPLFSGLGLFIVFFTVMLPVYIIAQMKLNYKITMLNTDLKTISFKMFLLPITRTYRLDYFDGYMNTIVKEVWRIQMFLPGKRRKVDV
ncbi:hypothetical protein [Pedobacter miscanthi]|jgi:hypothetical protein|uniref:hypothetical protein n=1 Tax=Pedobacter miscanthi TaxID=2259170 RepID=UPI00292E0800|nr:hypothetical protein [Pedobacter miscanthi]